ncbi:MAG: DUF4416 family protein [Sphaerochaetaceae bacterium]|nr:DUF4416 family protein [Sphaerochaetaceae bacterium]
MRSRLHLKSLVAFATRFGSLGPIPAHSDMGREQVFLPHRLVMGVLVSKHEMIPLVKELLVARYGPILDSTEPSSFAFTDYYDDEMGGKPLRFYLSFAHLIDPSRLSTIKRETNALEAEFTKDGGRRVNLDPGLLSQANLVLATTKNRAHRIPLSDGIYAELTLMYANKQFQSFPWTYADYTSEEVKLLFASWRERYRRQLKQEGLL